MATFPGGVHDFGNAHVDDVDEIIHAYSLNDLNTEVVAMETWLRANLVTARTIHPLTLASPALNYSAYDASFADPSYFVDAAGVCHWQGVIDPNGVSADLEFISGAPAPSDGKTHMFPVLAKNDGAPYIGDDTYSMGTSAGWSLPSGTGYSNAFVSYGADGWVRLGGVLVANSTYGYGSYITSLVKPNDFAQHLYTADDLDGPGRIQLMLDQYGNLLTGPYCNTVNAIAGHRYSLEGIAFKASVPSHILVMPNGNGRFEGMIPIGTSQVGDAGHAGHGRVSLDGIHYYVGL